MYIEIYQSRSQAWFGWQWALVEVWRSDGNILVIATSIGVRFEISGQLRTTISALIDRGGRIRRRVDFYRSDGKVALIESLSRDVRGGMNPNFEHDAVPIRVLADPVQIGRAHV